MAISRFRLTFQYPWGRRASLHNPTLSLIGPSGASTHACVISVTRVYIIQPVKVWITWWPMEQRGGGVGSGEVDSATQITCTQSGEQVIPQGKPGAFLKN